MKFSDIFSLGTKDDLVRLASSYRRTYSGPAADVVLQDLADVCCVTSPALAENEDGSVDEATTVANAAKQAVYLHIRNMMKMGGATAETVEDIFEREKEQL